MYLSMSKNDITLVGFTTVIVAFPTSINKELILRIVYREITKRLLTVSLELLFS